MAKLTQEELVLEQFTLLNETLAGDLQKTGFNEDVPLPGEEPRLKQGADKMDIPELKAAYDEYLAFYEYLTTQIIRFSARLSVLQEKLEYVRAGVVLRVGKSYPNAETREAATKTDPGVVSAGMDVLYLKVMKDALTERRHKLTKTMDRLYRELMLRTDRMGPLGNPNFQPPATVREWARPVTPAVNRFAKRLTSD